MALTEFNLLSSIHWGFNLHDQAELVKPSNQCIVYHLLIPARDYNHAIITVTYKGVRTQRNMQGVHVGEDSSGHEQRIAQLSVHITGTSGITLKL